MREWPIRKSPMVSLKGICSGSSAGSEWRQALFLLKPPVQLTMGSWPMSGSATSKKGPSAAEGTCLQSGQSTCMASTDEPLNARVAWAQNHSQLMT